MLLNFTLEGETYSIPFSQIDSYHSYFMKYAFVYGAAIGSCIITALMMWVCSSKKTSPIFILNQLTLLLMLIRSVLFTVYLRGPFTTMSYTVLFDSFPVPNAYQAYQITVAASVIEIPLVTCIQLLLIYQIFTVFRTQKFKQLKFILVGIFSFLAAAIVAIYIYSIVAFAEDLKVYYEPTYKADQYASWTSSLPFTLFSASVIASSTVFICKLILAIRSRQVLGLKQFSPFHVLVIMSSQAMIIPSILLIIGFTTESSYNPTIGMLITVLSLPLSSMWAFSLNNNQHPTSSALSLISRSSSGSSEKTAISTAINSYSMFSKTQKEGLDLEKGDAITESKLEDQYFEGTHSEASYEMQLEGASLIDRKNCIISVTEENLK